MRVLFLYTELAAYFVHCCEALLRMADVHVVRWPVNKEAPFNFRFPEKLKVYDKGAYPREKLGKLVAGIAPDIIICSGWIDKDYLSIVGSYNGKIPTVLALDTQWTGSLKQQLARLLSRVAIVNKFTHAWVPGDSQAAYAKKLGFRPSSVRLGFYCCELELFNRYYDETTETKKAQFPHRFLYVGRYYDFKGLPELWEAFAGLSHAERKDWELWCVGTGTLDPFQHEAVRHFGFIQPQNLGPLLKDAGVFVLPSRFEPWGVVVQEMGAAGLPLLLSDAVGAASAFLREGQNGELFEANNKRAISRALKKIIALSNNDLFLMAEQSHKLAQQITPDKWAHTVKGIYEEWHAK